MCDVFLLLKGHAYSALMRLLGGDSWETNALYVGGLDAEQSSKSIVTVHEKDIMYDIVSVGRNKNTAIHTWEDQGIC